MYDSAFLTPRRYCSLRSLCSVKSWGLRLAVSSSRECQSIMRPTHYWTARSRHSGKFMNTVFGKSLVEVEQFIVGWRLFVGLGLIYDFVYSASVEMAAWIVFYLDYFVALICVCVCVFSLIQYKYNRCYRLWRASLPFVSTSLLIGLLIFLLSFYLCLCLLNFNIRLCFYFIPFADILKSDTLVCMFRPGLKVCSFSLKAYFGPDSC